MQHRCSEIAKKNSIALQHIQQYISSGKGSEFEFGVFIEKSLKKYSINLSSELKKPEKERKALLLHSLGDAMHDLGLGNLLEQIPRKTLESKDLTVISSDIDMNLNMNPYHVYSESTFSREFQVRQTILRSLLKNNRILLKIPSQRQLNLTLNMKKIQQLYLEYLNYHTLLKLETAFFRDFVFVFSPCAPYRVTGNKIHIPLNFDAKIIGKEISTYIHELSKG